MLMQAGIPYDSEKGRAICRRLTAILTGDAYATSAEMAKELGPFPGYDENSEAMLRVIRNHRRAAYDVANQAEYEGYERSNPARRHRRSSPTATRWPEACSTPPASAGTAPSDLGEKHGYRNAQTTVIAPTGTIGLLMDCDTTGVEPDFALGEVQEAGRRRLLQDRQPVAGPALRTLGYDEAGPRHPPVRHGHARPAPGRRTSTGSALGGAHRRGAGQDRGRRCPACSRSPSPSTRGPSARRRCSASDHREREYKRPTSTCSSSASRAADRRGQRRHLRPGHGRGRAAPQGRAPAGVRLRQQVRQAGKRFIHRRRPHPDDGRAQPFISGAISKTINLPNEATVEDIESSYYMLWELGLKANALYRDGSKPSQPLSASPTTTASTRRTNLWPGAPRRSSSSPSTYPGWSLPPRRTPTGVPPPASCSRRAVPGCTQEARIGGHKLYLRTGEYDDGTLGELFIDLAKEGATLRGGVLSCFAIAVSKGLQYGVPLEEFVDTFTFQTFEPRG